MAAPIPTEHMANASGSAHPGFLVYLHSTSDSGGQWYTA